MNVETQEGKREQWSSKTEFLLTVCGNVVGLGNVWRFPYLCYKNGGGAFLVPYLLYVGLCGLPLFLLETSIGQYTQQGIVTCWRSLCPLAEGVGRAELLILTYDSIIYLVILAWTLFYLVFSFSSQLPWASCGNTWNTDQCVDFTSLNHTANCTSNITTTSAATEFWERRVLAISGGIEEVGSVRWELMLCLLACWAVCYFCVWKGIRYSGKVVYFTATFPYLMLFVLLVRGLTLPGAWEGIQFYLYPDPVRLADPQVWMEAGTQVFFSYCIGRGSQTVLGSFNKYNNNCYMDSFWLCLLNGCTSFVAGFAVFSVLGFMAQKQGVSVAMVAESGPGLAFIAFPQAAAMMPLPQLWTVCFFIMLLLLGIDTQFVIMEGVITSFTDLFPVTLRRPRYREGFVLLFCLSCFLIQLTLITEGGIFVFQLIDYYGCSGACVLFVAVFESLAVGWIFGADHMEDAIKDMTAQRPCVLFRLCWRYFTPLVSLTSFILHMVDYKPLKFNRWYMYPDWAYALGWAMALSSILLVPLWGIGKICVGTGSLRQRLAVLCHPDDDLPLSRQGKCQNSEMETLQDINKHI
ncbi:sodium- and chloride-dependent GABA transporter 2-like isoform X1 [Oncorhynchus nerka]|uniref:sodium- and chloride-dependent GABA transporter 2-like isoform X1 n=1 Tax=Oncorhynchus nerka TaxID=8023 RepID=UPI0011306B81|nr:sodium- and chloride-dependent GABA transporter 2-like isoform X1 [Oncorhynchus nerka]